jgi:hypothetical protein
VQRLAVHVLVREPVEARSLIGLGVLLLAGGSAWQRVRPLPLPDLREAEAA